MITRAPETVAPVRHRRDNEHYYSGDPNTGGARRPEHHRPDRRRREQDRGRQRLRERAEPGPPAAIGQHETRAPQRREQVAQVAPVERERHDAVRAGDGAENRDGFARGRFAASA